MRQDLRQTISEIILPQLILISQVLLLQHFPEIKFVIIINPLEKFYFQIIIIHKPNSNLSDGQK